MSATMMAAVGALGWFGRGLLPDGAGGFLLTTILVHLLGAAGLAFGARWGTVTALVAATFWIGTQAIAAVVLLSASSTAPKMTAFILLLSVCAYWGLVAWLALRIRRSRQPATAEAAPRPSA